MLRKLLGSCFALVLLAVPVSAAGDELPSWLRQAAGLKLPAYDKKVSSVVLVDESNMVVGEDGRVTRTSLYAVRILTRDGRDSAVAAESYETDSGKIREIRAWLIQPSGKFTSYDNDNVVDEADLDDVYNESRVKKIVARNEADSGSVFGYMIVSEMRPFFNQSMWYFQGVDPVLSSKLTLTLPSGWRANGDHF